MNIVFGITYFVWLLSEILLNRLFRSKGTDKKGADKHTLFLIWITIVVVLFVAIFASMNFDFPIVNFIIIRYIGLAVIWFGIILRLVIIASLGEFFTVDVTIRQNHQLKKDGFYKFLRHPSYFASLLSFIGFGISLNNWIALILITIAIFTVFAVRIKIEEKALIERFGAEYCEYKKHTYKLIPFIF